MTTAPFFTVDSAWWPTIADTLTLPWDREAVLADMRYWDNEIRRKKRTKVPSRRWLAARWGWGDKRARTMLACPDWHDPRHTQGSQRGPKKVPLGSQEGPNLWWQATDITWVEVPLGSHWGPTGVPTGSTRAGLNKEPGTRNQEPEPPPTPQRGKRKRPKPEPWAAPDEVQQLAVDMTEAWGGRLSWLVASPLKGMTRLQCLAWWMGLYRTKGHDPPAEVYAAEVISGAWQAYLREDWARQPNRGIKTFLRPSSLPGWTETGDPNLPEVLDPERERLRAINASVGLDEWGQPLPDNVTKLEMHR